ncbi:hypothetical protein K7432_012911 [Basidiobolus ranarum]|uniref:Uncharacterized protein n=1 Tax=Basidiobolus ranarum TaxID=34480 RepID=A0ABR2VRJ1_9FUNG
MPSLKHLKRKLSGEYREMEKSTIFATSSTFFSNCFNLNFKSSEYDADDRMDFKCNPMGIIEDKTLLPNFEELLSTQQTIRVNLTPSIAI